MATIIDAEKCDSCGDCVDDCPVEAITLEEGSKAVIDDEECTDCGVCVDTCPNDAITMSDE
jgi:ferredoxin